MHSTELITRPADPEPLAEQRVNKHLLKSVKDFVEDLAAVAASSNFAAYRIIVTRVDETKVKAYHNLVDGYKRFFDSNKEQLAAGDFTSLDEPHISYVTDNGSFAFDFQDAFNKSTSSDQEVIKDHLNRIYEIMNSKSAEDLYIDKMFNELRDVKAMTREQQFAMVKRMFVDFTSQDFNLVKVTRAACRKTREIVSQDHQEGDNAKPLMDIVEIVEAVDFNNFNMLSFVELMGKMNALSNNDKSFGNIMSDVMGALTSDNGAVIENFMGNLSLTDK
jgi:hypothetical protein